LQSACAVFYCRLWPVRLYHIFQHYLINDSIFGKVLLNTTCALIFSTTLSENFLILKGIQRYTTINVHRSSCNVHSRYSYHISMKLEFSQQIFEKFSNIKFYKKSVQWGTKGQRDGPTDRHDTRNFANATSEGGREIKWGSTMASGEHLNRTS
jgi:hypothetical protein